MLLRADPCQPDHAGPAIDRGLEEPRRIGERDRVGLVAQLPHALIDRWIFHHRIDVRVELRGDLRWNLGGRKETVPTADVDSREPGFVQGRNVRKGARTLRAGDYERAH